MSAAPPPGSSPMAVLRRFMKPRPPAERCELCSLALGPEHAHLIEPANRRLLCCCDPCAILFSGQESPRYRRVRHRIQALPDFRMTDGQWDRLQVPINMAFFYHSSPANKVVALYPSPGGVVESLLTLEAWQSFVDDNPVLGELEPDVEALLVNRVGPARDSYRVSIDECFKLAGLLRSRWRGLSGGAEVWEEIGRFFARLKEQGS